MAQINSLLMPDPDNTRQVDVFTRTAVLPFFLSLHAKDWRIATKLLFSQQGFIDDLAVR
ncbi:hypothetical protein [Nitrosomonas aestuarii]|uniref:hypothetical protein n=1 Tax=Nitrosomonas aestuarii TaxID=52441 RepID=UPI001C62B6BA|nr:hypothetical protein [Nitrosomonas aestuarii]